jgi:DNA-binding transcriptional regulator WhiA
MSYTSIVKNEVSKLDMVETENISELSAIIRNIGQIGENIKISSENASEGYSH